jgi:hypothetical protein
MYIGLHVKYPLLLLQDFNKNWNFFNIYSKNAEISNFMKTLPVGAKLSHVDGQTDMTKLIVTVYNFVTCLKTECTISQTICMQLFL